MPLSGLSDSQGGHIKEQSPVAHCLCLLTMKSTNTTQVAGGGGGEEGRDESGPDL